MQNVTEHHLKLATSDGAGSEQCLPSPRRALAEVVEIAVDEALGAFTEIGEDFLPAKIENDYLLDLSHGRPWERNVSPFFDICQNL
jgi:hypothetical protein